MLIIGLVVIELLGATSSSPHRFMSTVTIFNFLYKRSDAFQELRILWQPRLQSSCAWFSYMFRKKEL